MDLQCLQQAFSQLFWGIAVHAKDLSGCLPSEHALQLAAQPSCRKSNQQNLGTIKCSNLCTEIVEYTSPDETAVCNLASIALPRYVKERRPSAGRSAKLIGSLDADNR